MTSPLLVRLGAHDRALMLRCATRRSSRASHLIWCAVTHLGGTTVSLTAAVVPAIGCCEWQRLSRFALATLVISHLLVQMVKRATARGRPSRSGSPRAIAEPDRFSFPSGHATASLAVALSYGIAVPMLSGPVVLLALLVGYSRVRLGVHYPSDVVAGQLLAILTALGVAGWP